MFRRILAVAAVALATVTAVEPAMAQRGDRGGDHRGDRGHNGGGRGGDWDRDGRGRDHDRGRRDNDLWDDDWNRGYYGGGRGHHRDWDDDDDWWVGLALGSALLGYALAPDPYDFSPYGNASPYGYGGGSYSYGGYPAQAPNAWGLRPNQCRWDREFGYWYNRPADVEVQRCADGYGSVYVVQGSHRFLQYR